MSAETFRGWHSRGYIPHFDGGEIPQMVTFRLADSFPQAMLETWKEELSRLPKPASDIERRKRIEAYLDKGFGSAWLKEVRVAEIVQKALLHFDNKRYRIHAWVIMPNHVHVLLTPCPGYALERILQAWKSYSAKEANRLLDRSGHFWQEDYFDRYIRNEDHFFRAIEYIESNPVKAGLCEKREDWKFGSGGHRVGMIEQAITT